MKGETLRQKDLAAILRSARRAHRSAWVSFLLASARGDLQAAARHKRIADQLGDAILEVDWEGVDANER